MRVRSGWMVALALAGASVAHAQAEPAPIDLFVPKTPPKEEAPVETEGAFGFELGVRIDAQLPVGEVFGGTSVKDMTAGQAALQVDLGWRIDPRWSVGAFTRYGIALVNGCTDNVSCSGHDLRLGVEGQLHLLPGSAIDPWIGLGAGYEWLSLSSSTSAVDTEVTFKGPTFALLDVGADYRVSDTVGVGPYLEASAGQFRSTGSSGLARKRAHLWVGLGVRGWFDFR